MGRALSLFVAVFLCSSASAKELATLYLGSRPVFVPYTKELGSELNAVTECSVQVKAKAWSQVEFQVIQSPDQWNDRSVTVDSIAVSTSLVEETLAARRSLEKLGKTWSRNRSISIFPVVSKSNKNLFEIVVSDYNDLFFTYGDTVRCVFDLDNPLTRPSYKIEPGLAPEPI